MKPILARLRLYWPLIKSMQTGLLVATGLTGYMTARCPALNIPTLVGLLVSLLAAISGSTILNMWWDRDIDAKMKRTKGRPLAAGKILPAEAFAAGVFLALLGVGLACYMNWLYGAIILAGLFFDVIIYTIWLKRRTCWSILWGGVSGAMPVLAGRALGLERLDWIGVLLALGVLFWIPIHILTFSMRYHDDYQAAGIPTFPSTFGLGKTRVIIAVSSILAALSMGLAAWGVGIEWGLMRLLVVLSVGLFGLALTVALRPSERVSFSLFKYASLYMLAAMILMMI